MTDEELKDEDLPSDEQLAAEDAEDAAEEKKQRPRSYHISFRDEKNMWQVKIAKGKVLKMFRPKTRQSPLPRKKRRTRTEASSFTRKAAVSVKQTY